ncbi:Alpha-protein kinase 3 [Dissostichus eleginoides]|uniref:non-specific serine/threonine protein kinase n=1 Tax=Dissostichus eleginoides TaxID=100907 RepID=A0AAD9BRW1_DISEL|nr:Alpha-protein kinase 3 [Dissostichus eleginoides]
MTSRRPMARSVSGNGRTGSFSEEEGSSSNGRSESRNPYLSNVRPENSYSRYSHYRPPRSTLCSVMAQLTEDIQPSFESTLKSKAVSENCNVKFSCVVSGYPAPELKWYKDDMEMDRYCGLPKYEIHRNGKTHTLHIYKSTLDDAAIYQVSASNSKGIVSCSGVLEVGTMNEYKIHQRKRHVPPLERRPAVKEPEAEEQLGAAAEPNGPVASQVLEKKISPPEETLAKKKIKITNVKDFFFGKTKKDSHDHIENKEGELNPSPVSTPPSFRLQTEQNQVGKSLQEEVVPMEMDQPKEPSKSVDIEQQSASLKPHEHKHEASVQHTVHPPEHKIPPESIDQPRGESVNAEDSPVEVMEVSVGPEIIGPGGEMSLSGLQVLTEAEEKYSQIVSAIKEDLVHQQEPDHLTHGPYEQERSPVPPVNVISESNSQCLGEAPCETLQAEKISSAKMGTEPDTGEGHSSNKSYEIKEVAQLDDKRNIFELEPAHNSEQLPQMNHASIPVISVSCTDDKEDEVCVKARQADDTPTVPLFVVPPISITCHESDSGLTLPTESEWTETETSAAPQRGTKQDADDENNTTAAEKNQSAKQKQVKTSEKGIKENTPSMLDEALIPKVGDNVLSFNNVAKDNIVPEVLKVKPLKEAKIENTVSVEDLQRNRPSVERLCFKPPPHPSLSPASLRKFMSRASQDSDILTNDKTDEDLSGGSTPTSSLSCESSPRLKRRDSLTLIRSATPEELASGARRKIFMPKPKEDGEGAVVGALDTLSKKESPYMSPSQARRAALLQAPTGQNTPPMERRSPLLSRRKATLEVPKVVEQTLTVEPVSTKPEEKPAENKLDPLKAPQVIRKIRGEPFPDASGHLKLWCQFFNVLSDSTIKWYRDEEEILEVKRSGGDESQVALAVVLASSHDCGVYGCTINNEYGTDTTDFLLSEDILSEILLKDDLEVGEEIEMTPLLFSKGLADCGSWGEKYFGRIMTETAQIGEGCAHKASKVKVIYGLDPVFESGSACIIKVQSPIAYGNTQESNLPDKNLQITKQECKVQNMMREYCKIFAAEARLIENFGFSLEVVPQYLMYRPANSVPYATLEADLKGEFLKYCRMDPKGRLITQTGSEVEQKCSTFQHWIHQWTHGNLLVTRLEGVETKITNVGVVTKSKGYQGLTEQGSPEVFEQFLTHHQCNYYCGLLGLRSLKSIDSQPTKIKGSRSPLLNRKLGSNSPQLQRKGQSPQTSRKASPKVTRRVQETEDNKSGAKPKPAVTVDVLEVR